MAVESVDKLFAYNEWAWQRVFPSLAAIHEEAYFAAQPFFWRSLHRVTVHSYGAEWIWLQRIRGESPPALPSADQFASLAAVRYVWDPLRDEWRDFISNLREEDLNKTFRSRNTEGRHYTILLGDLLRHVVNHATEHRSQITPIVFQLGYPTEPLDYSRFAGTFLEES
ncbi:MAG: DinB family protein [Caldilineaceae bacterium]|nr:DinB family protein [Caldilineaceae bacterium]